MDSHAAESTEGGLVTHDLLGRLLVPDPPPFALLHRPESTGIGLLEVLSGEVSTVDTLAEIAVPAAPTDLGRARPEVLAVIPYRQLAERGFSCVDDGSPLLAMRVREHDMVTVAEALQRIPDEPIELADAHFDPDDAGYAQTVRTVVADEIGQGVGANFVIKRSFVADITGYSPRSALAFFRRLLERESGAYWTLLVHTGDRTFVGATPERHISLRDGIAVMNPISGTYRYPPAGPTLPQVLEFLADRKEADELYMVADEELKMMARICDTGGRLVGPYLKEMARVAHTEYFIEGRSSLEVREILRETMFAPTVTGSPLESACRVISRYERAGRGYYGGVAALIGHDERGGQTLDSSILIRTADIDRTGRTRIDVGATLVRHSDPDSEAAETRAKVAGLLGALSGGPQRLGSHPHVRKALERRNETIARFWLEPDCSRGGGDRWLAGRRVLVVDAEDTFTSMIGHQLRSLGLSVTVRRFDQPYTLGDYDLVVMGPGPGDPRDGRDARIAVLRATIRRLLDQRRPFLAVCLSHQVLSTLLGFEVLPAMVPNQGLQKEISLFGRRVRVGFYNTFTARCSTDRVECAGVRGVVEVSRDAGSGEVYALRGPGFRSVQFHAESVLSEDGVRIMRDQLTELSAEIVHSGATGNGNGAAHAGTRRMVGSE
jgi:2-amino-4-deoxychorismate synthase